MAAPIPQPQNTPVPGGFGQQPSSGGFGQQPSSGGFGQQPGSGGFGPPPAGSFGQPPPPSISGGSGGGKGVIIAVVIGAAVLGIGLVGGIAAMVGAAASSSSSSSSSSPPPIPIPVNYPYQGTLGPSPNYNVHELLISQRGQVTINVTSSYDNYLELYNATSDTPFLENDDGGQGLNAQINTVLNPGTYYVLFRPYSSGNTGEYTLTVTAPAEPGATGGPTGPQPPTGTPPTGGPGSSTIPPGSAIAPVTFAGTVSATSGSPPVQNGAQCTVFISGNPRSNRLNCRVRVICGGNVIYGADSGNNHYGFTTCVVNQSPSGGRTFQAADTGTTNTDGDPSISLNTAANQISVSDDGPWTVTVTLSGGGAANAPPTSI